MFYGIVVWREIDERSDFFNVGVWLLWVLMVGMVELLVV